MENIFEVKNESFYIKFDKLFEKPKLEIYNQFDLSSKRNFKMMTGSILETYEKIFLNEENGEFKENLSFTILNILNAQSKIMKDDKMTLQTFLSLLTTIIECADEALLKEIGAIIENGYGLSLDETTKKMRQQKKSVNDQLVISDYQAKILIKIAYVDRILIPLISQYFIYNKSEFPNKSSIVIDDSDEDSDSEDLVFSEINQVIFEHIFSVVAKNEKDNLLQKIYKLCYSRIILTSQNSKKFWNVAKNDGITKESASFEIYSKLISNSIPKIQLNKDLNLVNFLSTIIRNQIMFLFSNKFKVHYQTINPSSTDGSLFESNEDNMTELEKLENRLSRKNEGSLIINRLSIAQVLNSIDEIFDVPVLNEEINANLAYVHQNPIQEKIISLLSYKYFKSTDAIKQLNVFEYTKLLIACAKYLEQRKFVLLPKILLSKCIKQKDRSAITGNKIKMQIENAKRYNMLLEEKYKDFHSDIERNIQSLIATVYNSIFIDTAGNEVFDSAKIVDLANEVVEFAFLI